MASHKELIGHCVAALDSFDSNLYALEQHIQLYIYKQMGLEENDKTFIIEVVSGCVRYTSVLTVVVSGFFNRDGKTLLRSEQNLYRVMAYFALFRLDELGMSHFRKFVRSQDINKMYRFLNFLFTDKHLLTWMKDEWSRHYETVFVQTTLLSPLLGWLSELQEMLNEMKKKIDNKMKPRKPVISATKPEPFAITQPRARCIAMPEQIPTLTKHQPIPNTLYKQPQEREILTKLRETNRRKAEECLMEASKSQFACANPEKSEKTKQKIAKIRENEFNKLDFSKHKSNPVPSGILSENIPIKLNAAAILREGQLYKQREQKHLRKLEQLEAGAKDGSEFSEWQKKMLGADEQRQLTAIERRRLEGQLSHEQAILARQELTQSNRNKVHEMKQQAEKLMQDFMQKKLAEEADTRRLVEDVLDTQENAREARRRLQQDKARIVQQVTEESRELMRQALEEAEADMRQKMDLIREIRAMEAVPVNRTKLLDITHTAGHGLLSEMSIAELHERLGLLAQQQQLMEEEARDDILAGKQAREQRLMDTLSTISRHRTEQSRTAALRFEKRKKNHEQKVAIEDEQLTSLQQQLQEKRKHRKQQQQQHQPDPAALNRLRQLNSSKKALEQSRWSELEQSQERMARSSQSAARVARPTLLMSS